MSWITSSPEGVVLTLRVVPRANRTAIQGLLGDALKVRLQAPPVDGKANAALIEFFSDVLDIPRNRIEILSGATDRNKRVLIRGGTESMIRDRCGIQG